MKVTPLRSRTTPGASPPIARRNSPSSVLALERSSSPNARTRSSSPSGSTRTVSCPSSRILLRFAHRAVLPLTPLESMPPTLRRKRGMKSALGRPELQRTPVRPLELIQSLAPASGDLKRGSAGGSATGREAALPARGLPKTANAPSRLTSSETRPAWSHLHPPGRSDALQAIRHCASKPSLPEATRGNGRGQRSGPPGHPARRPARAPSWVKAGLTHSATHVPRNQTRVDVVSALLRRRVLAQAKHLHDLDRHLATRQVRSGERSPHSCPAAPARPSGLRWVGRRRGRWRPR